MNNLYSAFKKNKLYYFLQSMFSSIYIFLVLIALNDVLHGNILGAIGMSSIASSTFISFSEREARASTARHLIGGYVISIMVGAIFKLLLLYGMHHGQPYYGFTLRELSVAAVAVGVSMFLMLALDMKHPPAVGLTIGLVIETWLPKTIIVIFISLVVLFFMRLVLKPALRDLI